MPVIAKNLNRTVNAIQIKAHKLKLGPFLNAGEYITLNQFKIEILGTNNGSYTINQWIDKGLPVKTKRVINNSFRIIYLDDFWKWAAKNRNIIDFSKIKPLVFGKEPEWLEEQRKADAENKYFKKTPWTNSDDWYLETLVNQYKYTYREISLKLKRTEGAIKRRLVDLNIKARPVKRSNHNPWTEKETNLLIDLFNKGHTRNTYPNYINRSAQACSGKIERLIKEGVIEPRSKFKKTC